MDTVIYSGKVAGCNVYVGVQILLNYSMGGLGCAAILGASGICALLF